MNAAAIQTILHLANELPLPGQVLPALSLANEPDDVLYGYDLVW
jgi:hypothetical protein